jgi:dihydrofolate reductase
MSNVTLIAAISRNGGLGKAGQLLFRLPEDMAFFKAQTLGKVVLMGRQTYESLPPRFRPLPGRINVVLTTNQGYQAPGAVVVHTVAEALAAANGQQLMVAGGAQIYNLLLPFANQLLLTEIDAEADADAFFPAFNLTEWKKTVLSQGKAADTTYTFVQYERQKG